MQTNLIPERLREARKTLNLNQVQIATDLNIQQKSISDIENGKIQNIPNTYIYYFYKKGVSLEWLYDGKGSMFNNENKIQEEKQTNAFQKDFETPENELFVNPVTETTTNFEGNLPDASMFFERIIESKEMNIRTLYAYVKSVESNLDYLKTLLNQALQNK